MGRGGFASVRYVVPLRLPGVSQPSVGFPGSLHQKFETWEEAEQFLATVQERGHSQALYAVRKGRRPGIYTDWGTCKNQVYSMFTTLRRVVSPLTQYN